LIIGCFGTFALYHHLHPFSNGLFILGNCTLAFLNSICLYLFFNINKLQAIKRWKKLHQYLTVATDYSRSELLKLLLFAAIRFLIYSFQYYLLLQFFGVHLTLSQWAMSVFSIYIVQSFAPSFILLQIGIRGALALYFIELFSSNTVGILLAAYGIWIMNMMIPGIIGLYFLLTLKWSPKT
jgi:hypothetical protein